MPPYTLLASRFSLLASNFSLLTSNFKFLSEMSDLDPFQFFRLTVAWIATIYASIITLQSLYGWVIYLSGQEKYITVVRRYVIVHALRLRFKTFWGDVLICLLLCIVFFLLYRLHPLVEAGKL